MRLAAGAPARARVRNVPDGVAGEAAPCGLARIDRVIYDELCRGELISQVLACAGRGALMPGRPRWVRSGRFGAVTSPSRIPACGPPRGRAHGLRLAPDDGSSRALLRGRFSACTDGRLCALDGRSTALCAEVGGGGAGWPCGAGSGGVESLSRCDRTLFDQPFPMLLHRRSHQGADRDCHGAWQ